MLIAVTTPPTTVAVAVAPDPPPPINWTVGGNAYPTPPLCGAIVPIGTPITATAAAA